MTEHYRGLVKGARMQQMSTECLDVPLGTQDEQAQTPGLSSRSARSNERDTFAKGIPFREVTLDDKGGPSGVRRPESRHVDSSCD